MPRTNRTKVKVLKHHRTSDVFTDGRYLIANMKISTHSKKGRQIARETAEAILNEVMTSEEARDLMRQLQDSAALTARPRTVGVDPARRVRIEPCKINRHGAPMNHRGTELSTYPPEPKSKILMSYKNCCCSLGGLCAPQS